MRWTSKFAGMLAVLAVGSLCCTGQAPSGKPAAAGETLPPASEPLKVPVAQSTAGAGGDQAAVQTVLPDTRTEKQKALARQTERLFDMATELKVQVDKTNKNILSMKVVQKAEQIEQLAKGMKEQARK